MIDETWKKHKEEKNSYSFTFNYTFSLRLPGTNQPVAAELVVDWSRPIHIASEWSY